VLEAAIALQKKGGDGERLVVGRHPTEGKPACETLRLNPAERREKRPKAAIRNAVKNTRRAAACASPGKKGKRLGR